MKNRYGVLRRFFLVFLGVIFTISCLSSGGQQDRVRLPAVEGRFYPANADELKANISACFENCVRKQVNGEVRALISPHAGYVFSGVVAAAGYRLVDKAVDQVIILAPSHHFSFFNSSIPDIDYYTNCLGKIPLDPLSKKIRDNYHFVHDIPDAHIREHSLEVQLPFLQQHLRDFTLIPIVLGRQDPEQLANALIPLMKDNTLLIASSDLSHYQPYAKARETDQRMIDAIRDLDFSDAQKQSACGSLPILTLMHIAHKLKWTPAIIDYKNSGDTAGSKDRVVGYTSIVFTGDTFPGNETRLSESPSVEFHESLPSNAEKDFLLLLARKRIEAALAGKHIKVSVPPGSDFLTQTAGTFVTLRKGADLRGCIGTVMAYQPLVKDVFENAFKSALRDHRFQPVKLDELKDIHIDISILTKPSPLGYDGPKDLLQQLRHGTDGVVLHDGQHSATFLPQVWEMFPDKITFLERLSVKAGMDKDWWRGKDTNVSVYQTVTLREM